MSFYNCSVFLYSTVAGRKSETKLVVNKNNVRMIDTKRTLRDRDKSALLHSQDRQ